jgi:hypothetical protein
MTTTKFDAFASSTPRQFAACSQRPPAATVAQRIARIIWIAALLVRRDRIDFERYRRRFGTSERTFRRDIAALRDAGFYLDSGPRDTYRLVCFEADNDAA